MLEKSTFSIIIVWIFFRNNVASKMFDCNLNEIYEMDEFTFYNPSNKPKLCLMQKHVAAVLKYLKNNAKVVSFIYELFQQVSNRFYMM